MKTVQRGTFPVVGFIKDPSGVAALYLGKREGKDLVYMGKVGTGLNRTTSSKIRKALASVVSPKSKLSKPLRKPKATWVESVFAADIEYRDITSKGIAPSKFFQRTFPKVTHVVVRDQTSRLTELITVRFVATSGDESTAPAQLKTGRAQCRRGAVSSRQRPYKSG